jgi:1-acyl-sn-glycerol-3-phosphate acyltransferase
MVFGAWLLTGVRGEWVGTTPLPRQRIYFGNHRSHGDFVLIASALPPALRRNARPVAGSDYWDKDVLRRFIGRRVVDAVLIDRNPATRSADPIATMCEALDSGASLILFPEGTRNVGDDEPLLPFRSGLWHLARARPGVELVPCWIANVGRVLPKGELFPIPLLCTVYFGPPVEVSDSDDKETFLARARQSLIDIRDSHDPGARA